MVVSQKVIAKPAAFAGGVGGSASWTAWMLVLSMA
jgi:hypothetical protein